MINYIFVLDQMISHTTPLPFPFPGIQQGQPMPENARHNVRLVEHGINTSYDMPYP
jgi:hypothetical protein